MSGKNFWQQILLQTLPFSDVISSTIQVCSPAAITYPDVPHIHVLNLTAFEVHNFSATTMEAWDSPIRQLAGVNFCNVTVTYTHPGQNDVLNVQTWLPLKAWNGRFQGVSGGGWVTGLANFLPLRVHQGYASSVTDGGHAPESEPDEWSLNPDNSVNRYALENFAHVALHELALIGKAVTKAYYGREPHHSYWNGCSTGGRQGLAIAQRYPHDFDGIIANAPANNWAKFIVAEYWPQVVMNHLGVYPELCEFNAITDSAVEACDLLDGVKDGVVSAPGLCDFDPQTLVGESYNCNGTTKIFTKEAATIVAETWKGPIAADGVRRWYGLGPDAPLWLLPGTTCIDGQDGNKVCNPRPFWIAEEWIRLYVLNEKTADLTKLTYEQYDALFEASVKKYDNIISAANPDLSDFRSAGGKMITWHGLSDGAIFPNGSSEYYERVFEKDPDARDFYRFFEVPGAVHCAPGTGPFPQDVLGDLIKWVEHGQAPVKLRGEKINPVTLEIEMRRDICQWPLVARYIGGDHTQASSFVCDTGF